MIAGGITATGGARLLLHAHAGNAVLAAAGSALVWPALQQQANLALRAPRLVPALLLILALLLLPRRLLCALPAGIRTRLGLLPPPARSLEALEAAHLQRLTAASERDLMAAGMQEPEGSASRRPDAGAAEAAAPAGDGDGAAPAPAPGASQAAVGHETDSASDTGSGSGSWLAALLPLLLLYVLWPLAAASVGYLCGVLLGSPSQHYLEDVAAHMSMMWRMLGRLLRFLAAL